VVCIDGLEDGSKPAKAAITTQTVEAATSASASPIETHAALVKESEIDLFSTGSEVMDDILEHSQQRMLEAFAHLSKRIDGLAAHKPTQRGVDPGQPVDVGYVDLSFMSGHFLIVRTALGHLRTRIEKIETRQQEFIVMMNQLRQTIRGWDDEVHELNVSHCTSRRWSSSCLEMAIGCDLIRRREVIRPGRGQK